MWFGRFGPEPRLGPSAALSFQRKLSALSLTERARRLRVRTAEVRMKAGRGQLVSMLEWAVAAGCVLLVAGVGSIAVREIRSVSAVTPVIARETATAAPAPAGVPPRAVSVPMLLLSDGNAVRVGDSLADIAARLGRQAEVGRQLIETGSRGDRLIRFYEHASDRFVLVLESLEPGAEPRVAAIYAQ